MNSSKINSVDRLHSGVVLQAAASTSSTASDDWTTSTRAGGADRTAVGSTCAGMSRRKREPLLGLIVAALREAGDRGLILSSIYRYVVDHSPDYTDVNSSEDGRTSAAWRKNVRHILSVRNFFIKTAELNPDGRGRFWRLDEVKYAEFISERSEATETRDRRPTDVAPSRGDVDNYMASVQSLSALTDNHTVTSFPLSAGTPAHFQFVPPTAGFYDLRGQSSSTIHGQYMESSQANRYDLPAYWWHDGQAQPRRNVNGYPGAIADGHDWFNYRLHHHAQQHMESSAWHRGWSVRYHPYATASAGAATTAGCRTHSVGVAPSSSMSTACRYVCNGVDQRAPAYVPQSYSHSLGDANHNCIRQMTYDARQPAYITYPTPQADCHRRVQQ